MISDRSPSLARKCHSAATPHLVNTHAHTLRTLTTELAVLAALLHEVRSVATDSGRRLHTAVYVLQWLAPRYPKGRRSIFAAPPPRPQLRRPPTGSPKPAKAMAPSRLGILCRAGRNHDCESDDQTTRVGKKDEGGSILVSMERGVLMQRWLSGARACATTPEFVHVLIRALRAAFCYTHHWLASLFVRVAWVESRWAG